jgi:hypothetical protein
MTADPRPGARLPRDPDYWEQLSTRSTRAAFGPAAPAPALEPWWRAISDGAFALAAGAAFALLGGSLLLGARRATPSVDAQPVAQALAPDQPLLAALLDARGEPPSTALLLKLMALREGEAR